MGIYGQTAGHDINGASLRLDFSLRSLFVDAVTHPTKTTKTKAFSYIQEKAFAL